jgi:hypothetical protein
VSPLSCAVKLRGVLFSQMPQEHLQNHQSFFQVHIASLKVVWL